MTNYELQITSTCIQTYYNLHGVMPGAKELFEMLGEIYTKYVSVLIGEPADRAA